MSKPELGPGISPCISPLYPTSLHHTNNEAFHCLWKGPTSICTLPPLQNEQPPVWNTGTSKSIRYKQKWKISTCFHSNILLSSQVWKNTSLDSTWDECCPPLWHSVRLRQADASNRHLVRPKAFSSRLSWFRGVQNAFWENTDLGSDQIGEVKVCTLNCF